MTPEKVFGWSKFGLEMSTFTIFKNPSIKNRNIQEKFCFFGVQLKMAVQRDCKSNFE